jgi:drug/metabolite transporter (DMT)-like permease
MTTAPLILDADAAARQRGLLLVAGAAVLWSLGGLLVRFLGGVDVATVVFWRSSFAVLFLAGFIVWRDRGQALRVVLAIGWPGVLVGACFAAASTAFVVAVSLTTVANVLIVLATAPLIAAALARVFLKEPVRHATWLAMLAALAGVALMVSDSAAHGSLVGDAIAFITAFCFAVAAVTIRRHRAVRMTPAVGLGAFIAAVATLPFAAPLAVAGADLGLLAVFGTVQYGLGLALFATGARLAPAAPVAMLTLLEPILGPVWVWALLGEYPGAMTLVGGCVVLAALAVHTALDLRRPRPVPPAA